jgi:hypothetical protein
VKRWLGALLAVAAFTVAISTAGATTATRAVAASPHHAAVIVDDGSSVTKTVITFTSASVSGIQALQLAGQDPTTRGFSGMGAAVCAIRHRGCAADNSCLTCGGADYWAYYRAPSGTSTFTSSPVGAGATKVYDGDVEGWHWSAGTPPPYESVAAIGIPTSPPPTTRPTPVTMASTSPAHPTGPVAPGVTTTRGAGQSSGGGSATSTTRIGSPATPASTTTKVGAAGGTSVTRSATAGGKGTKNHQAAAPKVTGGDSGSGGSSLAIVGVLIAMVIAAFAIVRRRRAHKGRPAS